MEHYGWLSVLPPVIAIVLAIRTKQVFISLFIGIWLGWTIIAGWNPVAGIRDTFAAMIAVFQDAGNTRVVAFSALVGSLIALTQRSGGVVGFIAWLSRRNMIATRAHAMLFSWLIGVVIFVESSITSLVNGAVSRPLFEKLNISREKLAFLCDTTSAPICILLPLNGWGAFIISLLAAQSIEHPVEELIYTIPFNFYAIIALLVSLAVALGLRDFGPMKIAEAKALRQEPESEKKRESSLADEVMTLAPKDGIPHRAYNFIFPILTMVLMMPLGLLITGDGNLLQGSGSTAVFWSVLAAIAVAGILYRVQRIFDTAEITGLIFKGLGGMISLAVLMVFAFAIGATCKALGTGVFIAGGVGAFLPDYLAPALIFLLAGFTAFSTGTSWGTFAIMLPIAIPLAFQLDISLHLSIAAVLSGGVFGDHCSPVSDTTIIASLASGCDHIEHVRTQLPYALLAGGLSFLAFFFAGIFKYF